jgi:hypothetical protein
MSKHRLFGWLTALMMIAGWGLHSGVAEEASDMHLEVLLIWGTDEGKPADKPKLKELDPELVKKLRKAYRWKNYFEVDRKTTVVAAKSASSLQMSERCSLEIKNLGEDRLEVKLIGQGKPVSRSVESVPKGHTMVIGGEARNDTAWLIILRQTGK